MEAHPYINLYVARIIQEFLRRQPWCENSIVSNYGAWIQPTSIHKHFEKLTARGEEGQWSDSLRKPPLIEIKCEVANPPGRFMGNWNLEVEITITNDTQECTDEEHESRVNDVLALFYRDELITDLIAVQPQFSCPRVIPGTITDRTDGQSFSTSASFQFLDCCARDNR